MSLPDVPSGFEDARCARPRVILASHQGALCDIPARVRVLLFDWDGTLVDSTSANFGALRRALRAHGSDLSREWFLARTGMSAAEMVAQVAEETGRPIDVRAVVGERDAYYLAHVARVRPVHAVLALARAQQGVRRLAVVRFPS